MIVDINDLKYDVEIIRKNNKNTYIRVKNGKIIVTTNYLTSNKMINKLIMNNKDSIVKMINYDKKKVEKIDDFYYFGKKYDIVFGFDDFSIDDNRIYIKDKNMLDKFINSEIKKIYQERIDYWYNQFEEHIPIPNLKIRNMTSRWGVCNIKNNNVTLNYQLFKYDIKCLDYVVVHELSHFIHHDHSRNFWTLVSKYCPNYKEIKKMLKE